MIQNSLVKLGGGNSVDLSALLPVTKKTVVFTESDTWQVPDHVTKIWVTGCGGGGGGGGYYSSSTPTENAAGGGGGGGHVVIERELSVTPGSSLSITVGRGGDGGEAFADGINGGDSKIGSLLTIPGGKGGKAGYMGAGGAGGAAGGSGGGAGGMGNGATATAAAGEDGLRGAGGKKGIAGAGGGSFGNGGRGMSSKTDENSSESYPGFGGGGSGSMNSGASGGAGYAGGDGIVIIQYSLETPQPSPQIKQLTEIATISLSNHADTETGNGRVMMNLAVITGSGIITIMTASTSSFPSILIDNGDWIEARVYDGNDLRLFFNQYIIITGSNDRTTGNVSVVGLVQT